MACASSAPAQPWLAHASGGKLARSAACAGEGLWGAPGGLVAVVAPDQPQTSTETFGKKIQVSRDTKEQQMIIKRNTPA